MTFHVYIIANPQNRLYIGQTNDLERRLFEHNDPEFHGTRYTKRISGPWRLIHSETYASRSEAMKREKELKSGKGREWIKISLLPKKHE